MRSARGRRSGWRLRSVVPVIVGITVGVYILQLLTNDFEGLPFRVPYLYLPPLGSASPGAWGYWATGLLTYMILHVDAGHIIMNMLVFYFVGSHVERILRPKGLLTVYVGSGLIGALVWTLVRVLGVLVFKAPVQEVMPVKGASGAIFGIMVAAAMLTPNQVVYLFFVWPVKLKWVVLGVVGINVLSFFKVLHLGSRISYLGHLGGAVGGYLLIHFFYRQLVALDLSDVWRAMHRGRSRKRPDRRRGRGHSAYDPPDLEFVDDKNDTGEFDPDADPLTQIDPILDKIGRHGIKSLTREERRALDRARERLNKRG